MLNLKCSVKCAFVILEQVVMLLGLKLIMVSFSAGVRPLAKDEYLYLILCKLGKCVLAL
jgi:hypothetical protein